MKSSPPNIVIVAGPNGSGKSTAAPGLVHQYLGLTKFVNADTIARGLSAFDPESVSLQAGRIMLERIDDLVQQRESFAFETTLASRSFAPWLLNRKTEGFQIHLFFLWLPTPELALSRVATRVREGGHGVPESVVVRRFQRGITNLRTLYMPIVDSWRVFDASRGGQPLLAAFRVEDDTKILIPEVWSMIVKGHA